MPVVSFRGGRDDTNEAHAEAVFPCVISESMHVVMSFYVLAMPIFCLWLRTLWIGDRAGKGRRALPADLFSSELEPIRSDSS